MWPKTVATTDTRQTRTSADILDYNQLMVPNVSSVLSFLLSQDPKIKYNTVGEKTRKNCEKKKTVQSDRFHLVPGGGLMVGDGWSAGGSLVGWLMEIRMAHYY